MSEVLWLGSVRHINNRSAVGLHDARERIHRTAGMVTDVGDFTAALVNNDWLVRRSALQVAEARQFHVPLRLLIGRIGSRLSNGRAPGQDHIWNCRSVRRVSLRQDADG